MYIIMISVSREMLVAIVISIIQKNFFYSEVGPPRNKDV